VLGIHRKVPKIKPKPKLLSEAVLSDAVGGVLRSSALLATFSTIAANAPVGSVEKELLG
jgi:hypothetical protein